MSNDIIELKVINLESYDQDDQCIIEISGQDLKDMRDIIVKVKDYTPHFYIEIPQHWTPSEANKLLNFLKNYNSFSYYIKKRFKLFDYLDKYDWGKFLVTAEIIKKYKLYWFTDRKEYRFIGLRFLNNDIKEKFIKIFSEHLLIPEISKEPILYKIYEHNIKTHDKFMYVKNFNIDDKIYIKDYKIIENNLYEISWKDIKSEK